MNRLTAIACAAALALCSQLAVAQSQDVTRNHSSLYYRIGGGSPTSRAGNPNAIALKLGVGGTLRLNYSCGKFDLGLSWSTLMNQFATLGTTIESAVKAGIAALPMYIFQRAQPGLYELFQTYSKKADVTIAAALKTCEEMEAEIKNGKDPYEQWIGLAKGEGWTAEASTNRDVVSAKTKVETNGGKNGVTWIGGTPAGGELQRPIRPVNDVAVAGYNLTMNVPVTSSNTVNYSHRKLPLSDTFPTPQAVADWVASVLGDTQVATCEGPNCPAKGGQIGTGLLPKFEAEIPNAESQLSVALASPNPSYADLTPASAPGMTISAEVVRAIRDLPPDIRAITASRLAKEIALSRTIDKALLARNVLLTGMTIPEVERADIARQELQRRVKDLNQYIDDLMFESRVRKEIVSNTSDLVLQAYQARRATSTATSVRPSADQAPVVDGRVK